MFNFNITNSNSPDHTTNINVSTPRRMIRIGVERR